MILNSITLATILFIIKASQVHAQSSLIPYSQLNPSTRFQNPTNFIGDLLGGSSQSGILTLSLIFGGLLVLVMLIAGGFTMLTNPTNPEAQAQGKSRITWAIAGFLLLFFSYWIIQILEVIFKISIV